VITYHQKFLTAKAKKGKETKRSGVFSDLIRHKLMKESQHQAPLMHLQTKGSMRLCG
jgi:hypothetical protein